MIEKHIEFMNLAIKQAEKAGQMAEVPIGAVLVAKTGEILAAAYNQTIQLKDPTAHAEILALRQAAHKINNYRLVDTTLYVTIEPCIMCMGAVVHARVKQVVFGASDPKWGAAGSLYNIADDLRLNHQPDIIQGVCHFECKTLIQNFFHERRA